MRHDLKCWPSPFRAIRKGIKTHEFRENDRNFQEGDSVDLHEWMPKKKQFTGDILTVKVTYITRGPAFGIPKGYCVMSVKRVSS